MVTLAVVERVDGTVRPFLVAIGIMALISFAVVGVSPGTLGVQHSTRVALAAAPATVWLRRVLGPFSRLLIALTNAVTPGKGFRDGPFESESELRDLVDMARDSALIEAGEREMIHSVFELGDTLAREVMVPRTDMVGDRRGPHEPAGDEPVPALAASRGSRCWGATSTTSSACSTSRTSSAGSTPTPTPGRCRSPS